MLKLAKDFFNNQKIKVQTKEDFLKSDLYMHLFSLYGAKPYFSDKGLIKVVKEEDGYIFSEHIFYDWMEGKEAECYVNIEGIELIGTKIINTEEGKQLSEKGYNSYQNPDWFMDRVLSKFPSFTYNRTGCEHSLFEPYGTHKFGSQIWETKDPIFPNEDIKIFYTEMKRYISQLITFSEPLMSLDAYDMNTLEWRKGRSMEPHNGLDYRSMINLITSNTEHCDSSRHLMVGEYDWYDTLFYCSASQDWEPLLNISTERKQTNAFVSNTNLAVLINVFNPKFYHQVGEFKGEGKLYVCTANKSFRSIVDRFDFSW
jgi:hypothetical protein